MYGRMYGSVFFRKSRRVAFDLTGVVLRLAIRRRRNPRLWVFGNIQGFRDNSRYLYEYVREHEPEIEAVWIANDHREKRLVEGRGGRAELRWSPVAVWTVASAGVGVISVGLRDLAHPISRDMLIVNLFHGIPLKKLGLDTRGELEVVSGFTALNRLNKRLLERSLDRYDLVVAASSLCKERFRTAFGLPEERIPVCGQARTDILFSGCEGADLRDCAGLPERVVLYAPTWRETGVDPATFLRLDEWEPLLQETSATLLLKLHPLSKMHDGQQSSSSRIRFITDQDIEFTHLLYHTDVLISDYSGAILDFSLLGRPIILFAPDVEEYARSRGLYEPISALGTRLISGDQESLLDAVGEALEHPGAFGPASTRIATRYHDFLDAGNCARTFGMILDRTSRERESRHPRKRER